VLQKLKKKNLTVLVIFIMVLALCVALPILATAEGTATVTVGSTTTAAAPGDSITIPVVITSNPGITAYGFAISYDSSNLTLDSISKTDNDSNTTDLCTSGSFTPNTASAGTGYVSWLDGGADITGTGNLFYLTFTVKNTAMGGNYAVSCTLTDGSAANCKNYAGSNVGVSFTDGIIEVVAPDTTAPTMTSVAPGEGLVALGASDNLVLTVTADDDAALSELEIDHSMEGTLPEFSVYADIANPYGTADDKAQFESAGVSVTYADGVWTIDFGSTITNTIVNNGGITFYMVLKDTSGNSWGSMSPTTAENTYAYTIARDTTAPTMTSVEPAEGAVELDASEDFVLTVTAHDDIELYELEIDHSMSSTLPEFSVYANSENPYGTAEDKAEFEAAGVSVTYGGGVWTIDFGDTATDAFVANGGITLYIVVKDMAGNSWGSMSPTTVENTYAYTITRKYIAAANFTDGVYAITSGGEYKLATDAAGTIQISTTDPVTISGNGTTGTANSGLSIDNTVAGADLTIEDLYITGAVTGSGMVEFTGKDNKLSLSGVSTLQRIGGSVWGNALIHVPATADLTIDGDGTVYLAQDGDGAAIGGNPSEINGNITINGGEIFCRSNKTGSSIGGGQSANGGNITINGGELNIFHNARGAILGGGGYSGSLVGNGGTVTMTGGNVSLFVNFTGAAIGGGGGSNSALEQDGGDLYITGGSLKTYINSNALSFWGLTTEGVTPVIITADKSTGVGGNAVHLLTMDVSGVTANDTGAAYVAYLDNETTDPIYSGGLHSYAYTGTSTNAMTYWQKSTTDNNLYLYVTGENHTVTVNDQKFNVTWDSGTSGFSVAAAPKIWDGTANTGWYNTTDTEFHLTMGNQLAGLAQIVNGTATGITQDSFSGKTVNIDNDIYLNDGTTSNNWTPIGDITHHFDGVFNGGGYNIYGMKIIATKGYAGLFGNVSGTVKNFKLYGSVTINSAIDGDIAKGSKTNTDNDFVGAAVGKLNAGGTISNVINYAPIEAKECMNVGGIVGFVGTPVTYGTKSDAYAEYNSNPSGSNTYVLNCGNNATVHGFYKLGGIAGESAGIVMYCYNTGYILPHMHGSGGGWGGIVGRNGNNNTATEVGTIAYCWNSGTVTDNGMNDDHNETIKWYGGITAFCNSKSSVHNCYNIGAIPAGRNTFSSIIGNCESTMVYNNCSLISTSINSDSTYEKNLGIQFEESDFKSAANTDTSILTVLGPVFVADTGNINNGYPVLRWQAGSSAEPTLTSVSLFSVPTKIAYYELETFNPAGMKLKATYSDGTYAILSGGFTYPTDPLSDSTNSVTVSYGGFDITQAITVYNLDSIAVTTQPTKTVYNATDLFNRSGMVVTVYYSDNTSKVIYSYTYPTTPLTDDMTSVTIGYGDKTTTQPITVNALGLTVIAVTTVPTKTFYLPDESFDNTGMVVNATYNSAVVQPLAAEDYVVTPASLTIGTTAVTISFTYLGVTQTASTPVTVISATPALVDGYYQIVSADDLRWFADYVSVQGNTTACAKLVNDITLTSDWTQPIGNSTNKFAGTFDGNGKTISGLDNAAVTTQNFGLIGYGLGATVKDLTVGGEISTTASNTGLVAGWADGCTFTNITANGSLTRASGTLNNTAGITGYACNASVLTNCVNNAAITSGGQYTGGIAGSADGATSFSGCINNGVINTTHRYIGGIVGSFGGTGNITSCINKGAVTATYNVGGIAGRYNSTGSMENCYNSGAIVATLSSTSTAYAAGGVIGYFGGAGTIDTCYNSGDVTGAIGNVGGVVGCMYAANSILTNSYNTGDVCYTGNATTPCVGGVVGATNDVSCTIQNCYNRGAVTFATTKPLIGSVVGTPKIGYTAISNNYYLNTTSADATSTAKTAAELKNLAATLGASYKAGGISPIFTWQPDEVFTSAAPVVNVDTVTADVPDTIVIGANANVEINASAVTVEDINTSNVSIPAALVENLDNAQSVTIVTNMGNITFDNAALADIVDNATTSLTLGLDRTSDADGVTVYELTLKDSGGNNVFTEGSATVTLPYTLAEAKSPDSVKVFYVASNGTKTEVTNCTYANGYVTFTVEHFSTYSIEADSTTISAITAATNANAGETFTVDVKVSGDAAQQFASMSANLNYDKTKVAFVSFAAGAGTTEASAYDNTTTAKVNILESGADKTIGADGFVIGTITFRALTAISTGNSVAAFSISDGMVGDSGTPTPAVSALSGANISVNLHNLAVIFQQGTGNTLAASTAYAKYNAAGLFASNAYTDTFTIPTPAASDGYRLADILWNNGTNNYTSEQVAALAITANATMTAQSVKTYAVSFYNSDAAQIGSTQNIDTGLTATAPADPTAPAGTAFVGWFIAASSDATYDGIATLYSKAQIDLAAVTADTIYKAYYSDNEYAITVPVDVTVVSGVTDSKAKHNTDVVFTVSTTTVDQGYTITVSYKVGTADAVIITKDAENKYTIPGSAITDATVITVQKTINGTISYINYDNYKGAPANYKVALLTLSDSAPADSKYQYDGQDMFLAQPVNTTAAYGTGAYVFFVASDEDAVTTLSKIAIVSGTQLTVDYDGNVNGLSEVEINDAQLVYDLYNNNTNYSSDFNLATMLMRFEADVNGDGTIGVNDIRMIYSTIRGITE